MTIGRLESYKAAGYRNGSHLKSNQIKTQPQDPKYEPKPSELQPKP